MKRETVQKWLKEKHQDDRQWLAELCGKSINTVYTWFSSRPIPSDAEKLIQREMDKEAEEERVLKLIPQQLVVHFNDEEFGLICDVATAEGKRVKDWAEDTLNQIAAQKNKPTLLTSDPAEFKAKRTPPKKTVKKQA